MLAPPSMPLSTDRIIEIQGECFAEDVPLEFAMGTLRLSTGRHTTDEEVHRAAALIIQEAERQWAENDKEPAAAAA